jgi:putative copper export protein
MCVKLVLVAGLLSLAAFNKFRLTPRLLAGDAAAAHGLRRSIHAEMALAAAILLTTAVLTTLFGPPALG